MIKDEGRALVAQRRVADDGTLELVSPVVGYYRDAPGRDVILGPGARIGAIEVLGAAYDVLAPDGAVGRVLRGPRVARRPVSYGDPLLSLDPTVLTDATRAPAAVVEADVVENVFRAPMAGRFYARPSPGKPPFVEVGQEVEAGRTVALLEIMKTFNRLPYGGAGVPARCRVVELLVSDGDDVAAGQPLFRYEPAR
jgi:acetyl-CoA carboxylase biotin carboxyl carrier protein